VVGEADTAIALGSGDVPVLATPRLLAWLEAATVRAAAVLPPGRTSVGTRVELDHLHATPVGAEVTCSASVVAADGRQLTLEVEATEQRAAGPVVVARGRVVRAVVERERFLGRAAGSGAS
jgi:predicted thioesterase